ncbi:CRAL-TRIO domain-containing protein [Cokeromyces recurvatus]|uniref:CRAL-TRIO domain-containing protein n=1 Tax=Cokeromyces recurvatus TaxID=90255 RepID=UPI00221F539E|nr:CRAL-TRIO domain-containing protein [Cokeromyces recurvatus]KAI7900272.1 CRAL-TRIO domain-containing protein [Cokeromyces recurvatus]
MGSVELQEQIITLNSQFNDNYELIKSLQDKLLQYFLENNLSLAELNDVKDYIKDEVTIFRFLKLCKFDFQKAYTKLLETIHWRIANDVAHINWENECREFFDPEAVAFFHGTDNTESHPLLFVRLRYIPRKFIDKNKSFKEYIKSYACLIMEMARKLTWDMTCEKSKRGDPYPLVSRMTVIVNVSKAPIIPVDVELIRMMSMILDDRFPECISSIHVLNFGWMYQGLWSILKYLLNEEAKSFIRFTSIPELQPIISEDKILKEMEGSNSYIWTVENDPILQRYGTAHQDVKTILKVELPHTPPLSSVADSLSRSSSNTYSTSSSSDVFYDALEPSSPISSRALSMDTTIPVSTPSPLTPSTLIKQTTFPLPGATTLYPTTKSYFGHLSSWIGLRKGIDYLTSFITTQREIQQQSLFIKDPNLNNKGRKDSSIIIVEPPLVNTTTTVPKESLSSNVYTLLDQISSVLKQLTHHLIQLSFGPKRGIVYWILMYLFLRGPVETIVKKSLTHTPWLVRPKHISTASLGITATIAAITSSSLSNVLQRY